MTNQEKKAYLMRYRTADDEINDLLREKERIMARLTKMTSAVSNMPHGPQQPDKLTDGVAAIIELDAKIDRKVDALLDFRQEIETKIAELKDARMERILKMRYLYGYSWNRICVEMAALQTCYGASERWVYLLHGKALSAIDL